MTTFKIPVSWEVCGFIRVEAESLEKALEFAQANEDTFELPSDNVYIDASFRIEDDIEVVRCYQPS